REIFSAFAVSLKWYSQNTVCVVDAPAFWRRTVYVNPSIGGASRDCRTMSSSAALRESIESRFGSRSPAEALALRWRAMVLVESFILGCGPSGDATFSAGCRSLNHLKLTAITGAASVVPAGF